MSEHEALIRQWREEGFRLPFEEPGKFYDEAYWSRDKFRLYPAVQAGGDITVCEYLPPAKEWHGFAVTLEAFWYALQYKPSSLVDIGCGAGSLVDYARRDGINAIGCDVSEAAINDPVPGAKGHVFCADITHPAAIRDADVVTATDLMEHIHEDDLDYVINGLYRVAQKHVCLCVCVARKTSDAWTHVKGDPVPLDRAWIAVAGHVTLRPWNWWTKRLTKDGWAPNWPAMHSYDCFWALHPALKAVESWCPANVIIMSKH